MDAATASVVTVGRLLGPRVFENGDQGRCVPIPDAGAGLEPLGEGAETRLGERLCFSPEGTDAQRRRPPPLRRVLVVLAHTLDRTVNVRWHCLETESNTCKP